MAVWQRLARLHVGVIGCGRTGSLVASSMARLGIDRMTIIDPDTIELHNLGEMDVVCDEDVGWPKAIAVANRLGELLPQNAHIRSIVQPISEPITMRAVKECDVLFCCVDNDAARLTAAIVATVHHRVLVDIGTGVFSEQREADAGHSQAGQGFDVRLILPADGCLLCRGGLSNYNEAVEGVIHQSGWPPNREQSDWRAQRAGSLRTLNQLAAGLGVQMLQDLVAERINRSTWAQGEFNEEGLLDIHYASRPTFDTTENCSLCARAGLGDLTLRRL